MRIVFMGTPEFAVPALDKLVRDGYDIAAVFTQPDKEAGRGRLPVATPVKLAALELGLRLEQPASLKTAEAGQPLSAIQPEVIIVAAYGKLLPANLLSLPPHGVLNIHPSLLPRFRGPAPVASAILSGSEFTGVSVMLLDEGMDTGPVLARTPVSISKGDTTGSLTGKLARVGADLLADVLPRWRKGQLAPQPQDESQATVTRKFAKEDGEIDWSLTAVELWRRIRAFAPWPGCYTWWRGKQLKITEAFPMPPVSDIKAGEVITREGEATFGVGTGSGVLGVVKVQLESKREMPAAEFLRGQRDFFRAVLPS